MGMEEVRKHVAGYLDNVPGLLAILVSDRDGVPVVKASLPECPESATRPTFLANGFSGSLAEQASKIGAGPCTGMVAVYQTHQLVHCLCQDLVVTMVAKADSNTGHMNSLVETMRPFLTDLSNAVVE